MAITDKNRIYDGWASLEGGVDAGRNSSTLEGNQSVAAVNLTFRGGDAVTRPGFRMLPVLEDTFTNPNHCYHANGTDAGDSPVTGQEAWTIYKTGVFQCARGYTPHNGEDCLMAMIGGRLFKVVPRVSHSLVTEITPIEDEASPYIGVWNNRGDQRIPYRNKKELPIGYMEQADKFLMVQDGLSKAIIYDGKKARRSAIEGDADHTEIPVGTMLAYGMGRICTIVNGRDVAFGDLYGSHDLEDPADSLPLFTERNFLAEGGDAAIPFNQGIATGMAFFPQLDTSTGNGQLMVFAERGAASFFMSLPRELWKTSAFQILALLTTGMRGHRSLAAVNEDLWFRSDDGMRTYRQARSEASGWAHIPLSTNVKQFLGNDSGWLLKYASSIYFDNRIIITTGPVWNQGRPYHTSMLVVDFDIVSSFGTRFKPAWDGQWIKRPILQLVTGEFNGTTRAFFFGIDEDGYNQLYEISVADKNDWDGEIAWSLESRAFAFGQQSTAFSENELYDADVWLKDIN
jgi:hypothetical protein